MTDQPARGTLEHCLARGVRANVLLKRFQAVVSEQEMALVRYWFDELHRRSEQYLRQGFELVSVGFDHRNAWNAGPFMVFNPTSWQGCRRRLLTPDADGNPRQWVTIQVRSMARSAAVQPRAHADWRSPALQASRRPASSGRSRHAAAVQSLQPALHD